MSPVQNELPRVSDAAARHTIDAARAFKEFLRVREALKEFEGSMHWKKVEPYEYLVHKKGRKHVYLGPRSVETQARFEAFTAQKYKLESRFKTLRETVETSQRVNKAVRAGSVPSAVIEVLCALDEAGLGQDSLLVGSPALYAYGQRSGLRIDAIKAPGDTTSVAEERHQHLWVIVDTAESPMRRIDVLRHAVKSAEITPLALPSSRQVVLEICYGKHDPPQGRRAPNQSASRTPAPTVTALDPPWAGVRSEAAVLDMLNRAPKFEQVVIGRTGRMAMMRTLDPLVFVALAGWLHPRSADTPAHAGRRQSQVELVSRMLADYLVTSKLQDEPGQGSAMLKGFLDTLGCTTPCAAVPVPDRLDPPATT